MKRSDGLRSSVLHLASAALPLALLAADLNAQSRLQFAEVSDQAGLAGGVRSVAPASRYISMHGGGVVGDFNNDGYHDIFMLAGGGVPDYLFINNTDGTFSEQASDWGVDYANYSFGASAADFNNDGYLDIFVTSYGSAAFTPAAGKMLLYKNNGPDANGNYSFSDVAIECGVNRLYGTTRDGIGSGWGDYDLDGDLDLFVCGYNESRPCNRLFRNNGPESNYSFTDVTVEAELEQVEVPGFIPRFVDINGDLLPDLILVADTGRSRVYINDADGTFTDITASVHGIETASAMGVDVGDINNDGRLDMYISSITYTTTNGPGNVLLIQQPDGSFQNTARDNGTYSGYWGWGVLMQDFDHDRDLDLAETNGFGGDYNGRPAVLFENLGDGDTFNEVAQDAGFLHTGQGRGMSRIDYDNDGDLDIVIYENVGRLRLYENRTIIDNSTAPDRNWVRIKLDTSARDTLAPQGIGAMIRLYTGEHTRLLSMNCGANHSCSSPVEVHAGLDDSTIIDIVQVQWPDGSYTTLSDVPADQIMTINAPATPVDYAPDGVTDFNDVFAFLSLYTDADLGADQNGDLALNFFDVAAFIRDYRTALMP